jgi:TFIIF-interacting CTD phosphatase-like protein
MVIVDNSPYTYVLNMDNAVPILPFFGDSKDS